MILPTRLHGMDDRLTAVVEAQNHELEKQPPAVEAEKELFGGHLLIGCADEDTVLDCIEDVLLR